MRKALFENRPDEKQNPVKRHHAAVVTDQKGRLKEGCWGKTTPGNTLLKGLDVLDLTSKNSKWQDDVNFDESSFWHL